MGFLYGTEDEPPQAEEDGVGETGLAALRRWEERLAKAVVKCSIVSIMRFMRGGTHVGETRLPEVVPPTTPTIRTSPPPPTPPQPPSTPTSTLPPSLPLLSPWSASNSSPRACYEAAVTVMVKLAEQSGLVAEIVASLCRTDRRACSSLAAYQQLLTEQRRRLLLLRNHPGDRFMLWVAINGLCASNAQWHRELVASMAAGSMLWSDLMAQMATKACRETRHKMETQQKQQSDNYHSQGNSNSDPSAMAENVE